MITRSFLIILLSTCFVADADAQPTRRKRHPHHSSKARSEARSIGHKIGEPFRHVGGHLQKFFTGHNTISR